VRKVVCSYPRTTDPHVFEAAYKAAKIELELVPQGTLSERMRAAAAGLGGFFTRTSAGTKIAAGKETREIDGKLYVLEKPLSGDVALLKALKADAGAISSIANRRGISIGDGERGGAHHRPSRRDRRAGRARSRGGRHAGFSSTASSSHERS